MYKLLLFALQFVFFTWIAKIFLRLSEATKPIRPSFNRRSKLTSDVA